MAANGHRVTACFLRCEFVLVWRRVLVVGLCKQPAPDIHCGTTNIPNFRRLDQENGEVESVFYSMSALRHHCCIEWWPTWFSSACLQAEKYFRRKGHICPCRYRCRVRGIMMCRTRGLNQLIITTDMNTYIFKEQSIQFVRSWCVIQCLMFEIHTVCVWVKDDS